MTILTITAACAVKVINLFFPGRKMSDEKNLSTACALGCTLSFLQFDKSSSGIGSFFLVTNLCDLFFFRSCYFSYISTRCSDACFKILKNAVILQWNVTVIFFSIFTSLDSFNFHFNFGKIDWKSPIYYFSLVIISSSF